MDIDTIIQPLLEKIIAIRQALHANPELGFQQASSAKMITDALTQFGLMIHSKPEDKGVVALLDSGKPGKTVGLRADFDALPILEQGDLPYKSIYHGKMHACGHDGHTANLLCVAALLNQMRSTFKGKIKFIFQPAEELGAGANAMIEEGVLENPYVDAIFGLHNWPGLPLGQVAVKTDTLLSGITTFDCLLKGKGGHASMPHLCIDPITLAAQFINQLQTIISRQISADEFAVLSITKIHAGDAYNIIPDQVILSGSIRFTSLDMQKRLLKLIEQHGKALVQSVGGEFLLHVLHSVPPTINSEIEAQQVYQTAINCLGRQHARWLTRPFPVTEDFAFFLQNRPGSYFLIGNGEDSEKLHTAHYDFNDHLLPNAAKVMAQVAIDYLNDQ